MLKDIEWLKKYSIAGDMAAAAIVGIVPAIASMMPTLMPAGLKPGQKKQAPACFLDIPKSSLIMNAITLKARAYDFMYRSDMSGFIMKHSDDNQKATGIPAKETDTKLTPKSNDAGTASLFMKDCNDKYE